MTARSPADGPGIQVRTRHRSTRSSGFIVEIDPRLPDAVSGRMVYHSPDDRYLGPPHRHDAPHDFVCLNGSCAVALELPAGGVVRWLPLGKGDRLHVPPRVAHRVWLAAGAVFASLEPALSWLTSSSYLEELPIDEGWRR